MAFDLQGHRGARALFPENTLEGFRATAALGVTSIELDIGVTADGIPVVYHDAALNPDITRDSRGAWLEGAGPLLRDLTLDALKTYDVGRIRPGSATDARFPRQAPRDGARIPTLRETLGALPAMRFNIELKLTPEHRDRTVAPAVMTALVLAEIDRADAVGRVSVQSFDWRPMHWLAAHRPDIALGFLTQDEGAGLWWDLPSPDRLPVPVIAAARGRAAHWAPAHRMVTPAQIAQAQAAGLRVLPWTVNDRAEMAELLAWGVDGLITDDPVLAREVLSAAGSFRPG